jgi:membrane protease YdiL (CAAX protease family)
VLSASFVCEQCQGPIREGAVFCASCGASASGNATLPGAPSGVGKLPRVGTASWADLKRLMIFYEILLTISLTIGLARRASGRPEVAIVYWVLFIPVVLIFTFLDWKSISRAFKPRNPKVRTVVELLGISVAVVLFLNVYFGAFQYFHWPVVVMSEAFTRAHWSVASIFIMFSVLPGIFEETAFRGLLQTKLSKILSVKEALIIQAGLFSVLHLSPFIFVSHFIMGIFLGWVRLRAGHIYFGIVLHMLWNAACLAQELGHPVFHILR